MPKIVKFIEEATEEDIDSRIVIHCQMGISRSAATLAGYLITKGKS
jgi:protein-tyrosine phosphatase